VNWFCIFQLDAFGVFIPNPYKASMKCTGRTKDFAFERVMGIGLHAVIYALNEAQSIRVLLYAGNRV
jgi:hypothetical protein